MIMEISQETPKDRSYLIQPGEVRNPGGRPKEVAHVKELARKWTTEAIETLAAIMQDKKEKGSARVAAANALLDRGYGRAPAVIEVDKQAVMDIGEAARRIAFAMNGAILSGQAIDAEFMELLNEDEEAPIAKLPGRKAPAGGGADV